MNKFMYRSSVESDNLPEYCTVENCSGGIAWTVLGPERRYTHSFPTEPDTDSALVDTGRVVVVMVGDDRLFAFPRDRITPLSEDAFCISCGQIGCKHP